jgi:hypothetical protein
MDTALREISGIQFPKSAGLKVNMMPFIIGDPNSLPNNMKQYQGIIDLCNIPNDEIGKVGYLTIDEGLVKGGNSQRRGGIHTEGHPTRSWGGGGGEGHWGRKGGIYMASNLSNTTKAWNTMIHEPGEGGDCEMYRENLGEGQTLKGNTLYWMTDRTPHEALLQSEEKFRQFFRFVTSDVSLWYADHSTPNPLGVEPQCEIINGNKFE